MIEKQISGVKIKASNIDPNRTITDEEKEELIQKHIERVQRELNERENIKCKAKGNL